MCIRDRFLSVTVIEVLCVPHDWFVKDDSFIALGLLEFRVNLAKKRYFNHKLKLLYKGHSVMGFVKFQKRRWARDIERMEENRISVRATNTICGKQ